MCACVSLSFLAAVFRQRVHAAALHLSPAAAEKINK